VISFRLAAVRSELGVTESLCRYPLRYSGEDGQSNPRFAVRFGRNTTDARGRWHAEGTGHAARDATSHTAHYWPKFVIPCEVRKQVSSS